jgi:hypothetical protein
MSFVMGEPGVLVLWRGVSTHCGGSSEVSVSLAQRIGCNRGALLRVVAGLGLTVKGLYA